MSNRKEEILIVALHLFARDGYEAVSVSQIAGKLDMTKGALYRHYKSKRDIFDCIVQRMEQQDGEQASAYDMPEEEAKGKKFAGGTTLYYVKEMGMKTAADYLSETDKPTFIMQGEKDFQVLADVDFAKFKELFSDRPNTRFKLYENLNHAFVPCIYDDISKATKEYKVERHIGDEVIDDIADFVKNN